MAAAIFWATHHLVAIQARVTLSALACAGSHIASAMARAKRFVLTIMFGGGQLAMIPMVLVIAFALARVEVTNPMPRATRTQF